MSILENLLGEGIDPSTVIALEENLTGNSALQKGEVSVAVEAYDRALRSNSSTQEGVLLAMRSEALLARGFSHRSALDDLEVYDESYVRTLAWIPAIPSPSASLSLLKLQLDEAERAVRSSRKAGFHLALYNRSLLGALRDSVTATKLLPHLWANPSRAAEIFTLLGRYPEAAKYYRMAAESTSSEDARNLSLARARAAEDV